MNLDFSYVGLRVDNFTWHTFYHAYTGKNGQNNMNTCETAL